MNAIKPGRNRFRHLVLNLSAAVAAPPIVQALFIASAWMIGPPAPWYNNFASQVVASLIGFVFVVRAVGIYSLVAGLVYLPVMFYLLIYFTVTFNAAVYGNWL